MLFALIYLLLRHLVRLLANSSNDLKSEVEVVVLRHQLMVLKRHVAGPRLRRRDRLFMAAVSRTLPRARWSSFLVSPEGHKNLGSGPVIRSLFESLDLLSAATRGNPHCPMGQTPVS